MESYTLISIPCTHPHCVGVGGGRYPTETFIIAACISEWKRKYECMHGGLNKSFPFLIAWRCSGKMSCYTVIKRGQNTIMRVCNNDDNHIHVHAGSYNHGCKKCQFHEVMGVLCNAQRVEKVAVHLSKEGNTQGENNLLVTRIALTTAYTRL